MNKVQEATMVVASSLYGCGFAQLVSLPGLLITLCEQKRHVRAIKTYETKLAALDPQDLSFDAQYSKLETKKENHKIKAEKCTYIKSAFIAGLSIPLVAGVNFARAIHLKEKAHSPMKSFKYMAASWYGCGFSQIAALPGAFFSLIIGAGHSAHAKILERKLREITPQSEKQREEAARCYKLAKFFIGGLTPFAGGMMFAQGVMHMNARRRLLAATKD